MVYRGGGSTSRLGGRELTLLCGFNQYTLLQNRDNSGLLGTPLYCSLKLGGGGAMPPQRSSWGAAAPPAPPVEPPLVYTVEPLKDTFGTSRFDHCGEVRSEIIFIDCVYESTFSLSFVGS